MWYPCAEPPSEIDLGKITAMFGIARRQRWSRCLGNRVAAPTGVFRPDVPDHSEPARDIVEDLGDVFAEPSHFAAAGWTDAGAVVLWLVHGLLTRQVVRQWLALWPVAVTDRRWCFS